MSVVSREPVQPIKYYAGLSAVIIINTSKVSYFAKYIWEWAPAIKTPCSSVKKQPAYQRREEIGNAQREDKSHKHI